MRRSFGRAEKAENRRRISSGKRMGGISMKKRRQGRTRRRLKSLYAKVFNYADRGSICISCRCRRGKPRCAAFLSRLRDCSGQIPVR